MLVKNLELRTSITERALMEVKSYGVNTAR